MELWVKVCIWESMSAIIALYMAEKTNFKVMQIQKLNEKADFSYTKYAWNPISIVIFLTVVLLSLCSGYVAALISVSDFAWLELSISYMCLLSAAIIDYKLHIIPNAISFLLMVSRVLILLLEIVFDFFLFINLADSILGCVLCFLVLMAMDKVFSGGIGTGDIKLLSALGFLCGVYTVFFTLLLALFCCIIVSVILLLMKKVSLKDHLPFGPFIWMGFVCMILFAY